MKTAARLLVIFAAFAGILAFSSPNYASTLASSSIFGIGPRVLPEEIKERLELQSPPLLYKKQKNRPDPYEHAFKVAKAFAASA